ncbi:MAG: hypothetical protein QXS42_00405 [Zestosphaera sp.]
MDRREPHVLINLFGLSGGSVSEALQNMGRHRDVDGFYVGDWVDEVGDDLRQLASGLAESLSHPHLILKVRKPEVLRELDLLTGELQKVEVVAVVTDLNALGSGGRERLRIGFETLNPYPNLSKLAGLGITYLVTPLALLRSRTAREAEAKGLRVIALNVNSPENYMKSRNLKVYAVVTDKPTIRREAESLI